MDENVHDFPYYMTKDEYVECGGNRCPNCRSDNISSIRSPEFENNYIFREIECSNCGEAWFEVYDLIGYERRG